MLSDIEIAKQAKMLKIGEVAAKLGISEDEYEPYGHYKAKLSESLYAKTKNDPDGKLILVTAINPTPAGEGTWSCFWYQGRCGWRWIRSGRSYGRHQFALHRRYARYNCG